MRYQISISLALLSVLVLVAPAHAISLIGFYKLDDASAGLPTMAATVGTNGTYENSFTGANLQQPFSPGDILGNSVVFTPGGGTQRATISGNMPGGIPANASNFSVTMWVNQTGSSSDRTFMSKGSFNENQPFLFWFDSSAPNSSSNTISALSIGPSGGSARNEGASNALPLDGQWHLVGATVDAASLDDFDVKLYVDGDRTQSSRGSSTITGTGASTADTALGNTTSGPAAGKQFSGGMDEVAIWSRALTAPEMDALYFVSGAEEEFVTDAQGAAALFDLFEDGMTGDSLIIGNLQFSVVGDVTEFGGTAGQSVESNGRLLLGLDPNGPGGLLGQQVPEPASVAIWSLLGLAAAGFAYRRWRCSTR